MSTVAELRAELAAAGLAPNHRLGQNFMVDSAAIAALVSLLPATVERVVEIGPGTGRLTAPLLSSGRQLLAVELDHGLAGLVSQRFAHLPHFQLLEGDCLASKTQLHPGIVAFAQHGPWALCSNLPYDVSLPVLCNAVQLEHQPQVLAVTLQREAAERLCAQPGAEAWGATAALLQAAGQGRIVRRLSPSSFYPRPRVESALLLWQVERAVPRGFGAWLKAIFAARRKVLPRALRDRGLSLAQAQARLTACGLDSNERVERLSVQALLALYQSGSWELGT